MKKIIIILIVLSLVILGYLKISQYAQEQKKVSDLNSLISNGLAFYSSDVMKNLKIDSYFFLREVIRHIKSKPVLLSEDLYKDDLFVRLLNKEKYNTSINFSRPEKYSYKINPEYKQAKEEPLGSVLLKALYCDISGYTDEDFSILKVFNHGDGSYFDTHFLISLLFLKGNSCYQSEIIERSVKEVVASIIQAQKNDTSFSDLYVERIVVLYWAGYGENVEEQWINIVKENFNKKDSGWRNDRFHYSDSHTTGLALLSLIYYLEAKPEQFFY